MTARTITSYRHPLPDRVEQVPDTAPGPYYTSVRDGARYGLLAGPFATHTEALALVDSVAAMAETVDAWSVFYSFGTLRVREAYDKPGLLNEKLGVQPTYKAPAVRAEGAADVAAARPTVPVPVEPAAPRRRGRGRRGLPRR